MSSPSFLAHNDHAESSQHAATSGLTLVLPPLSALKAQKGKKKIKLTYGEPVKKQARPVKLKPLKEVLSKLIVQIKKKDDYAFFLQPVDPLQVPGYSDVISKPMDLGTMTKKVERGRYRSLEEFASDLRLVTTNAKTFNPPGSLYHNEAERIENYALDHIAKASATVIEYETDWNIDVERDDAPLEVDDDDVGGVSGTHAAEKFRGSMMEVDESRAGSPSAASLQAGGGKRAKGKKSTGTLSESLEADGGLPGAKDGLGAFPPGSDWAELMLALKLKGKRYRTKKERMRMEKGGPPLAADGSLDYPEMEDPFSVLSAMVPDPLSRPSLTPLYPPLESSDSDGPPLAAPAVVLPMQDSSDPSASSAQKSFRSIKPTKRRHWVINRNAPTRRPRDVAEDEAIPAWKNPRDPVATDFGTFATLPGALVKERKVRDAGAELGTEEKLFDALRGSLLTSPTPHASTSDVKIENNVDDYWDNKAAEAEGYIRDVVYGGVDGVAYIRSVAEFLTPSEPVLRSGESPTYSGLGMPVTQWVEGNIVDPLTGGLHGVLRDAAGVLNSLPPTPPQSPPSSPFVQSPSEQPVALSDPFRQQIELSLRTYPAAARALALLHAIHTAKIDLPSLIRAPDELFHAEDVWAGRAYREKRKREMDEALAQDPEKNAAAYLQWAIAEHREAEAGAGVGVKGATGGIVEDAGMLAYALEVAAEEITRLARGDAGQEAEGGGDGDVKDDGGNADTSEDSEETASDADADVVMKAEDETEAKEAIRESAGSASNDEVVGEAEDPVLKKLRLNLLALAKRAPLDQITKLPPHLIPAHLRHVVPTTDA